jgi:hypothetical protein
MPSSFGPVLLGFAVAGAALNAAGASGAETKVPVTISGGHEIAKNDFGRPVELIAAGLAVEPDVFRKAFSGVTPARGRGPTGAEARKNKDALMKVLGPHGVTNERLDEVSNYYRYQPQRGELWPTKAAKAHAIVEGGAIKKIVVTEPGSGYCSSPTVKVDGFEKVEFRTNLGFSKDLKKNGGISSIEVVEMKAKGALR